MKVECTSMQLTSDSFVQLEPSVQLNSACPAVQLDYSVLLDHSVQLNSESPSVQVPPFCTQQSVHIYQ